MKNPYQNAGRRSELAQAAEHWITLESGSDAALDPAATLVALAEWLHAAADAYYVWDTPVVEDAVYDRLFRWYRTLEEANPMFKPANAPSDRVGGSLREGFVKTQHRARLYSMEDVFTKEEVEQFVDRMDRELAGEVISYTVEPKLDGLACNLVYRDGQLVLAATRGDGITGEEITANVRTLRNIPLQLTTSATLDVRGEIVMFRQTFERVNREKIATGEEPFRNPRNAAAGSVRQLDPTLTARRGLMFYAYGTAPDDLPGCATEAELQNQLRDLGFDTVPGTVTAKTHDEIHAAVQALETSRDTYPFMLDGAVVRLQSRVQQRALGFTSRVPRFMVARKFAATTAETTVESVVVQVGRTGKLTPVANLEPVEIDGVTVARATLHNFDEVERLQLQTGARVQVERSGDVIPAINMVLAPPETAGPIAAPTHCPSCNSPVVRRGANLYCGGDRSCPDRLLEWLKFVVSRKVWNIDKLGIRALEAMVQQGWIKTPPDLLTLQYEQLLTLPLFAEKKAQTLTEELGQALTLPADRYLASLGIDMVGAETARVLTRHFGSLEELEAADEETLQEIDGIGPIVAHNLVTAREQEWYQQFAAAFVAAGGQLVWPQPLTDSNNLPWNDQVMVFTGNLEYSSRSEAQARAQALGATTPGSVSKKSTVVVAGPGAGSKLTKAESLGIEIWDEETFLAQAEQAEQAL